MMDSNHPFQNRIDDDLYVRTRGAGTHASLNVSPIIEKIREQFIQKKLDEFVNILVLGCHNGHNDVLPILDGCESSHIKLNLWGIDDSSPALTSLQNKLEQKKYIKKPESSKGHIIFSNNSNIIMHLVEDDIEKYPEIIFEKKFDIVISLFVLNHLTNWIKCIRKISDCLKRDGLFYISEYHDPLIAAIENYSTCDAPPSLIQNIFDFHKKRFHSTGNLYTSSLLGSNISNLKFLTINNFKISKTYSQRYSRETDKDDIKLRLSNFSLHTPINWGVEYKINVNPQRQKRRIEYKCESDRYKNFISNFLNKMQGDTINYDGELILYEFQKETTLLFQHSKELYQLLFGKINQIIESLRINEIETFHAELLLKQMVLGFQGLTRDSLFFSLIFWKIKYDKAQLVIDFSKSSGTFLSLFTNRSDCDYDSFEKYLIHLLIYRFHDTAPETKEKYSLAEIIFKYSKTDIDWVIEKSIDNEFNCKIIYNGSQTFLILSIPEKYLKIVKPHIFLNLSSIIAFKYNNFSSFDLSQIINNANDSLKKEIQQLDDILFNTESIQGEEEKRKKVVKSAFEKFDKSKEIWTPYELNELIENIAKRIPRFAYLTQLGTIVYLTNKLFNRPFLNNGGFFLCEKLDPVELESNQSSFSIRYRYLKDILNLYSHKKILPDISSLVIESGKALERETVKSAISAIMSRNMSHNLGSHVLADLVAKQDHKSTEELNHFYRYLQNRMDFIAQITTDFPEWTYAAYFNKELMRIFYENYILLDKIGVSEDLSAYKWNKDWRNEEMRGKIIVRTCIAQRENGREKDFAWVINEYHMGELNDDLQLAIPGGIVGYHAFYIIIENIVRNSAKHDYATRFRKSDFDEGHIDGDDIIFISYKNSGECGYWAANKNTVDEEMKSSDTKSINIKKCKTFVIESSCFKVDKKEEHKKRDFIKDDEFTLIDGQKITSSERVKVYIACVKNPNNCNFSAESKNNCQNCLVVDKKYWSEKKNYFQVLTNGEYNQLLGKTKISKEKENEELAMKKRYDSLIDFLEKGPLRINIRVDDMVDKDYVWVTIWDNMRHFASTKFDGNIKIDIDQNKEVCGGIDEADMKERVLEIPKIRDVDERNFKIINLFGFMNDRLRQPFIKETGELKREDWGIAELKICSGFLQNRKIEEIGTPGEYIIQFGKKPDDLKPSPDDIIDEQDNPNNGYPKMIIKALPVDKTGQYLPIKNKNGKGKWEKGDPYYLGYRFWMKKPKTAALVGIECHDKREKKDEN